MSGILFWHTV